MPVKSTVWSPSSSLYKLLLFLLYPPMCNFCLQLNTKTKKKKKWKTQKEAKYDDLSRRGSFIIHASLLGYLLSFLHFMNVMRKAIINAPMTKQHHFYQVSFNIIEYIYTSKLMDSCGGILCMKSSLSLNAPCCSDCFMLD